MRTYKGVLSLLKYFGADVYLDSIYGLTPELLEKLGIRALIMDLDNTVAAYNTMLPDDKVMEWFKTLRQAGIPIAVVSNNSEARVSRFCLPLGIPHFWEGGKPSPRIIRKAMEEIGAKPEYTAMVGDKLLTDVWGARRCGITAILVKPVGGRGIINYIRHKHKLKEVEKK
jgi:HAD superfamily phosphatase (TIGR01668 family)